MLKNWIEIKKEDKMLIGGDFNARTGEERESKRKMDG